VTLADFIIHYISGIGQNVVTQGQYSKKRVHGSFADRFSEEHRRKFKYFTRQGRYKERKYREQAEGSEEPELKQERL